MLLFFSLPACNNIRTMFSFLFLVILFRFWDVCIKNIVKIYVYFSVFIKIIYFKWKTVWTRILKSIFECKKMLLAVGKTTDD